MNSISFVFPNQLYENNLAISTEREVLLIEDELFFTQFNFHIQKIILHRLSMQEWAKDRRKKGFEIKIIESKVYRGLRKFVNELKQRNQELKEIHVTEPDDYLLKKRLIESALKNQIAIVWYKNPGFITDQKDFDALVEIDKGYFMHRFYVNQRKHLGILTDHVKKPLGGKWSFDADNRKKLPREFYLPALYKAKRTINFDEQVQLLQNQFPNAKGSPIDFNYPLTREDAILAFEHFLENKFIQFGPYEDAISKEHSFLFHSVLTPALNIGLITPIEVIDKTLDFANTNKVPLNSLEGFIRQIIGWREFIRIVYLQKGNYIRNQNFFNHSEEIPESFYNGISGIMPMDDLVKKLNRYAYSHHIERLMIAGNLMLLCKVNPNAIYQWFMEYYIDAYDWVMVPNVYSMSQYADGGLITTKPYLSGSAYILKMSDYKKGDWCQTWDGLYWRFIYDNLDFFKSNQRMSMMAALVNKMPSEKLETHLKNSQKIYNVK